MEDCRHGITSVCCTLCNPINNQRKQAQSKKRNQHSSDIDRISLSSQAVLIEDPSGFNYCLVKTARFSDYHRYSFEGLTINTTFVHIDGYPFLWAIKEILNRAPNVKTIEVAPKAMRYINPHSHLKLCREKGVRIVAGYHSPASAWGDDENRSLFYKMNRDFFRLLKGDQKKRFDELIAMGFESAEMAARYYCLNNEEFITQYLIAKEYGLKSNVTVSMRINAVRYYLDSLFETGKHSKKSASVLEKKISRLRPLLESQELRMDYAKKIGVPALPTGLPLARLSIYEVLIVASRDGKLNKIKKTNSRIHKVLTLRFGIDKGEYLTLDRVGKFLGGISRERVRQIETKGLELLGISMDEELIL